MRQSPTKTSDNLFPDRIYRSVSVTAAALSNRRFVKPRKVSVKRLKNLSVQSASNVQGVCDSELDCCCGWRKFRIWMIGPVKVVFALLALIWIHECCSSEYRDSRELQTDDFMGTLLPQTPQMKQQHRSAARPADVEEESRVITFNREFATVEKGRKEYNARRAVRKPLLCVTFLKATTRPMKMLESNMAVMGSNCEWAVIFYDGTYANIEGYCGESSSNKRFLSPDSEFTAEPIDRKNITVVHCKRAPETFNRPTTQIPLSDGTVLEQSISVPKSVLYSELLPILKYYEHVFMLDEDISLVDFNFAHFNNIVNCGFQGDLRPLIVQPVIAERTQYFPFVHAEFWQRLGRKVYASSSGLVEQQVPYFDALFLDWFVRHVLSQTREVALRQGVDQSHDRTWCRAAAMYSAVIMRANYTTEGGAPCAVIVGGATETVTAVHHLNTRSLENKKANRAAYRQKAQVVNDRYRELFPSWVVGEIRHSVSPLDKKYGRKYRKYQNINAKCLAKKSSARARRD